MGVVVHYEVYVLEARGWSLHARFGMEDRDSAVAEAKAVEQTLGLATRVVRETYIPEQNHSEEVVVYLSRHLRDGRPQEPVTQTRKSSGGARETATAGLADTDKGGSRDGPPTKTEIVGRLFGVLILGAVVAAAMTVGVAQLGGARDRLLMFLVPLATFLITTLPLLILHVPLNDLLQPSERPEDEPRRRGWLSALMERLRAPQLHPPDFGLMGPPPLDQPDEAALAAQQAAQDEAERLARERLEAAKAEATREEEEAESSSPHPDPQPPAPSPMEEADEEAIARARLVVLRFLGGLVNVVKRTRPQLDAYNRFGINLYLAGSSRQLSDRMGLSAEDEETLLLESVELMGTKAVLARGFAEKLEEYLLQPRYMAMAEAGSTAMSRYLDGESDDPFEPLGKLVEEWNRPQAGQREAAVVTVMFTDMVGSTSLTGSKGDKLALEAVHAHNAIVRSALAGHGGREVKHTGDGIMAVFTSAVEAVAAGVQIQRAVSAHNEQTPQTAFHLRVGLNAGEPIVENGDYFGFTVQLAARICGRAGSDEIWCSGVVRSLCSGKSFEFRDQGAIELKGVAEPQALWEVLWQPRPSEVIEGSGGQQRTAEAQGGGPTMPMPMSGAEGPVTSPRAKAAPRAGGQGGKDGTNDSLISARQ